jgi:hypothetical protein
MNRPTPLSTATLPIRNSISRWPLRRGLLLIPLALCFALSPAPNAFGVSPPLDGGYPGNNTAEGTDALFNLTTGVWNTAVGFRALYKDAAGVFNTAIGYQALYNSNALSSDPYIGYNNVAVGADALFNNTTGSSNIAIGSFALYNNSTGSNNIAIGSYAFFPNDFNGDGNTVVGDSFASGPTFVSVGREPIIDPRQGRTRDGVLTAHINAENDIYVGSVADQDPFHTYYTASVHIQAEHAVYIWAVYGNPIAGSSVNINSNGQLGVAPSSKRFKNEIKPMDETSEAILGLKPVTFRYKPELDPDGIPQFGLVAEEVEKVNPALITRDADGKPYTVRYEAVNAMLLNEFLKEHRKVEEQQATIAELKSSVGKQAASSARQEATVEQQQKEIKALTASLKEQASQIQKVSDQLEVSKPAPQIVVSNQ